MVTLAETSLKGLRLFVVEDEALVAMLLENMLDDLGCVVVDIVGSVAQALQRIDDIAADVDAAILDVNLGRDRVYPVADALAERGVPFVFATGYGPEGTSEKYPDRAVLSKPYNMRTLGEALTRLASTRGE